MLRVQATAGAAGQAEAVSGQSSKPKVDETSLGDENEKVITLGDALNQEKVNSLASVEELHNLAGGADIKVPDFLVCYLFTVTGFLDMLLIFFIGPRKQVIFPRCICRA